MNTAPWRNLRDDHGNNLPGIVGKSGAKGNALGKPIGGDIIRMEVGSAFPLHIHEGAHILYVLEGSGYVYMDSADYPIEAGDMVYVPANYPHGVKATCDSKLVLVAVGYPHHEVDSVERMKVVDDAC